MRKYKYKGKYGKIVVDIERKRILLDELKREKIWGDSKKQSGIYKEIIKRLFKEDITEIFPPRNEKELWAGEIIFYGFTGIMKDGTKFWIDSKSSGFLSGN